MFIHDFKYFGQLADGVRFDDAKCSEMMSTALVVSPSSFRIQILFTPIGEHSPCRFICIVDQTYLPAKNVHFGAGIEIRFIHIGQSRSFQKCFVHSLIELRIKKNPLYFNQRHLDNLFSTRTISMPLSSG